MHWRHKSSQILSKGSLHKLTGAVKSLSDLHEARTIHDSQFFTPKSISSFIWSIIEEYVTLHPERRNRIPIFDNSIGSGALVSGASSDLFEIYGFDIDKDSVSALCEDLDEAGFIHDVRSGSLVSMRAKGMGIGIVNPPFSIHLSSPLLEKSSATRFGRYGPDTSAVSHDYALAQALKASQIVFAVLPRGFAHSIEHRRLSTLIDLPADAFASENANVRATIAIFDRYGNQAKPEILDLATCDPVQIAYKLAKLSFDEIQPRLHTYREERGEKVIFTQNTGNNEVRLYRSKDLIKLSFKCGLTESKVLNGIYKKWIDKNKAPHRVPTNQRFTGDGLFYLPHYFAFKYPLDCLEELTERIVALGGLPRVCPQLIGYIRRQSKRYAAQLGGYSRWIQSESRKSNTLTVQKSFAADPSVFPAVIIRAGEQIEIVSKDGAEWSIGRENGELVKCVGSSIELNTIRASSVSYEWTRIGSSMAERSPDKAKNVRQRCQHHNVFEYCSWGFQQDDLVDALCSARGTLISAQQGLGKSRIAYALAQATESSRSLLVTLPQLKEQFLEEAGKIGVSVHVIESPGDLDNLGPINLITVSRLRTRVKGYRKRTYAKALRNRFGTVIVDECDMLRNTNTAQSKAIAQLGGARRYGLSGTPFANYPRDLIGVAQWVFGSGNVVQPFSHRKPYPNCESFYDATYSQRGIDYFRDRFVTLDWATMEWREDMQQKGAKREIPKIRNLREFREYASRLMIRRLRDEPMVAKHLPEIKITEEFHTINWKNEHLAHYLQVSEEFRNWFESESRSSNLSLVALLARIGAVTAAANNPNFPTKQSIKYSGSNSKEEALIDKLVAKTGDGSKSIVFLNSPQQARRLSELCKAEGIESILLTGEINNKIRNANLRDRYKEGDAMVCFATYGVARYGLNIPQASNVFCYDMRWSFTDLQQAIFRVLRPQQTRDVEVHFLHLESSIDVYMNQMVQFKKDASRSGLDFAEPSNELENFLHMDQITLDFCNDLKNLYRLDSMGDLRSHLLTA